MIKGKKETTGKKCIECSRLYIIKIKIKYSYRYKPIENSEWIHTKLLTVGTSKENSLWRSRISFLALYISWVAFCFHNEYLPISWVIREKKHTNNSFLRDKAFYYFIAAICPGLKVEEGVHFIIYS